MYKLNLNLYKTKSILMKLCKSEIKVMALKLGIHLIFISLPSSNTYWSALAIAPTSASAGAKVASNSTNFFVCFVFCLQP